MQPQDLQIQSTIRVYCPTKNPSTMEIPLSADQLDLTLKEFSESIRFLLGHTSYILLYEEPITCFNKLGYVPSDRKLGQIIEQLNEEGVNRRIAINYINTQYREESDYNTKAVYSIPAKDAKEVVLQICQNSFFVHQSYRLPPATKISFLISLCRRYGEFVCVQYYNTRLCLQEFGSEAIIGTALVPFEDHMGRITISTSSVMDRPASLQIIHQNEPILDKSYCRLSVQTGANKSALYSVDRRCRLKSLAQLLQISLQQPVVLNFASKPSKWFRWRQVGDHYYNDQQCINARIDWCNKVSFQLRTRLLKSQFIGTLTDACSQELVFVEQCSIVHLLRLNTFLCIYEETSRVCLPCPPSETLNEDQFYIKDSRFIIAYNITKKHLRVKQFESRGSLMFCKLFRWFHELYEIEFAINDLFCVRLKDEASRKLCRVRVFFVHQPDDYLDVPNCDIFYPAKAAHNCYSDGSTMFAVWNKPVGLITVYSLKQKEVVLSIRVQNCMPIQDVFFSEHPKMEDKLMGVNYGGKLLQIHALTGHLKQEVVGQEEMGNVFFIGDSIAHCHANQLTTMELGRGITRRWSKPERLPQNYLLLSPLTQNLMQVRRGFELHEFHGVYHHQQRSHESRVGN